ncbi:MAG: hypothetical protein ABIR58_05800 [Gemmatimonadaceae bacterium]
MTNGRQYIIKNAVLISAAIAIGATVRGGGMASETDSASPGSESADVGAT